MAVGARYDGWLLQLSDELYTLTQKAKNGADGYFEKQETLILGNTAAALAYGLEKAVVANTYGLSAVLAGAIGGACTTASAAIEAFGW